MQAIFAEAVKSVLKSKDEINKQRQLQQQEQKELGKLRGQILSKIIQINAMKGPLQEHSFFYQERRTDKLRCLTNLETKLSATAEKDDINETTLEQCCREVMSDRALNVEHQKHILAGFFWSHRLVDFLSEINPKIVTDIEAALKNGLPYRFQP